MIQKWKTLKRTTVFEHPRITLVEDAVELPNGKQITYLREHPTSTHSVAVIAVDDTGRVLLQKEYSYPPDQIMWQLPGGGIHHGEDIATAALRELSEESSLTATETSVIGHFYTSNRRSDQKQHVVVCTGITSRVLPSDPEEFIESSWKNLSEINALIQQGEIQNINFLAAMQIFSQSSFAPKK